MQRLSGMLALTMTLLLFSAEQVPAAAESAEATLRQVTEEIYRALDGECRPAARHSRHLQALVNEILLPHADFKRMSRWVLGKYWQRASIHQQQRFIQEFRVLLVRTYAAAIHTITPRHIHFLPSRASGKSNRAVVRTEVRQPGAAVLPIHYYMHLRDGRWLVYDIRIEGISLIANYRTTFGSMVREQGLQGLIDSLQQQNQRPAATTTAGTARAEKAGAC